MRYLTLAAIAIVLLACGCGTRSTGVSSPEPTLPSIIRVRWRVDVLGDGQVTPLMAGARFLTHGREAQSTLGRIALITYQVLPFRLANVTGGRSILTVRIKALDSGGRELAEAEQSGAFAVNGLLILPFELVGRQFLVFSAACDTVNDAGHASYDQ